MHGANSDARLDGNWLTPHGTSASKNGGNHQEHCQCATFHKRVMMPNLLLNAKVRFYFLHESQRVLSFPLCPEDLGAFMNQIKSGRRGASPSENSQSQSLLNR
jgi:hypothetical protein